MTQAEDHVKRWIEAHAKLTEQFSTSTRSRCFEEWLSKNGTWWNEREPVAKPKIHSRECYLNAWTLRKRLRRQARDIAYCEGVVFIEGMIIPVWHGWLVDRATGRVIDPSVRQDVQFAYCGHAFDDDFAHRAWIELEAERWIGIVGNSWQLKSVKVMQYLLNKEAQ